MSIFYNSFSFGGVSFLRSKHLNQLQKIEADANRLLLNLAMQQGGSVENVKSQIGQDLFVLYLLDWKKNGFFVEFGATNGVDLSNSYLLEKDFGWHGILVEPARVWHEELIKNRSAIIDFDCVYKETGLNLHFEVTRDPELSTLKNFELSDSLAGSRGSSISQTVKTVSLNDLLQRHQAPQKIDYLSIDTEGSEYEILKAFDFDSYDISIVTCEHNFSENRDKIHSLMNKNGFTRVFEGLSRWDDWYVKSLMINSKRFLY